MKKIQHTLALTFMTLGLVNTPCLAGLEKWLSFITPYLNEEGKTFSESLIQNSEDINSLFSNLINTLIPPILDFCNQT